MEVKFWVRCNICLGTASQHCYILKKGFGVNVLLLLLLTVQARCPTCNKPLTVDLSHAGPVSEPATATPGPAATATVSRKRKSILSRIARDAFQSSTKIEALREELHRMVAADASSKAIVFSQFTSMLELTQFRLEQVG